jgi:hypothetical protein
MDYFVQNRREDSWIILYKTVEIVGLFCERLFEPIITHGIVKVEFVLVEIIE